MEFKVEAIAKPQEPKTADKSRSHLKLITFYATFLPYMAPLLDPLYDRLKNKATWK